MRGDRYPRLTILLVVVSLAAGGAILALGGRFSQELDLLSHFAPIYGGVCAAGLLAAASLRLPGRRTVLGVALVGLVASGLLVAPEFTRPMGPTAAASAPGAIKVVEINALRTNRHIARVADWLIAEKPDVVIIAEARRDLRDRLIARTGWKTAGAHGSLIVFTPERYRTMTRPVVSRAAKFTFVNATYDSPTGPFEVVAARFFWPTEPETRKSLGALEYVTSQLPRERMIMAGDFNATPWSHQLRRLDRGLGLIRRDRAVATFPAQILGRAWPLPFLPIDHLYAGPGWATVSVERGPWLGSDHYPLVVVLAPVPEP